MSTLSRNLRETMMTTMIDKPDWLSRSGSERAKLLLVDDESQILRTLQATLASQGYEIKTAGNGLDGLILFREWRPDLVITDLSMPEMSGVELCREIRSIASTPIIVLSVREQEGAKVAALDAGADDYVTKPFNIQELKARVRAQLRRQGAQQAPMNQSVKVGDFVIDVPEHRVSVRGADIHLTPKQFDLLLFMAALAGQSAQPSGSAERRVGSQRDLAAGVSAGWRSAICARSLASVARSTFRPSRGWGIALLPNRKNRRSKRANGGLYSRGWFSVSLYELFIKSIRHL